MISFLFLNENICWGYSLRAPQRGASDEYPQHMFLMSTHNICFRWEIRKISAFFRWKKRLICCYAFSYVAALMFRKALLNFPHQNMWLCFTACTDKWNWSTVTTLFSYTVDSRYLEFQGTPCNTSRYPYLDISDLQSSGKYTSINHI